MLLDGMNIVALGTNVVSSLAPRAVCCFAASAVAVEGKTNWFPRRIGGCTTQFKDVVRDSHLCFGTLFAALVFKPGLLNRKGTPFASRVLGLVGRSRTP